MSKKNKRWIRRSVLLCVIIFIVALASLFLSGSSLLFKKEFLTPTPTPTQFPLFSNTLPSTPLPGGLLAYSDSYLSFHFPDHLWHVSSAYDCGEEDTEKVALYDIDPSTYVQNVPGVILNFCAQRLPADQSVDLLNTEKQIAQSFLESHRIDSLISGTFFGVKGISYIQQRHDFPGHYEKVTEFVKGKNIYRFTLSIQANSANEEDVFMQKTHHDIDAITASISIP